MTKPKEDRLGNFIKVKHVATNTEFLMHQSFVDSLGSKVKVQVYELPLRQFIPPNSTYPKGKYIARDKYFIGSYLQAV